MAMGNQINATPCRQLAWDSDFWGYSVAKLEGSMLRQGMEQEVLDWCHKKKIRCLYFCADGADAETLQCAQILGFQFVDVRLDMEYNACEPIALTSPGLEVRPVAELELEGIRALARKAHQDTRFFKDLHFDRHQCESLYEKWIDRDFEKGRILGFFPDDRDDAQGYVTFSLESREISRIGLIAVEDSYRGRGGGRKLLETAMTVSGDQGAKKIRVATQGTNVAALRLYEKVGFRVSDVKIWYHKWFPAQ